MEGADADCAKETDEPRIIAEALDSDIDFVQDHRLLFSMLDNLARTTPLLSAKNLEHRCGLIFQAACEREGDDCLALLAGAPRGHTRESLSQPFSCCSLRRILNVFQRDAKST